MDSIEKLMWLRQDIMMNIQLADNKAHSLMQNCGDVPGIEQLYLEVLSPTLETKEAPEGYKIFRAMSDNHIEHQCEICREILIKKYELINKMIKIINAYSDTLDDICDIEYSIDERLEAFKDEAVSIIYKDETEGDEIDEQ